MASLSPSTDLKPVVGPAKSSLPSKIYRLWLFLRSIVAAGWRGASLGALAAVVLYSIILAVTARFFSFAGSIFEVVLGIAMGFILVGALASLGDPLLLLLRLLTRVAGWALKPLLGERAAKPYKLLKRIPALLPRTLVGVTAFYLIMLMINPINGLLTPYLLLETLAGGLIGVALKGGYQRNLAVSLVGIAIILNLGLLYWVFSPGSDDYLVKTDPPASAPLLLNAPDPSLSGSYKVQTLLYGSGNDKMQPEYNGQIALKTPTVDASKLIPDWQGLGKDLRNLYLGFDAHNLPLNAHVWYPEGEGPFGLVVLVHGSHLMQAPSEEGYDYLGQLLASRGFITASLDENFINGGWFGDFGLETHPVRAWLILKHLEVWRTWNETPGNLFYHKIDLNDIALIGHSRGGEAVALAANFTNRYSYPGVPSEIIGFRSPVKAVIAIAPSDAYRYGKPITLQNLNYLVLQGAHDPDVTTFAGIRQYQRVNFNDDLYHFKSAIYIYRANHGQFSNAWGKYDYPFPVNTLLNVKPYLSIEEQQQIAKTYISAFLETSLRGDQRYLPLFQDQRVAPGWLPKDIYVTQFADSNFVRVADFEEDYVRNTTTLAGGSIEGNNLKSWQDVDLPMRDGEQKQDNSAALLGWDRSNNDQIPDYTLSLPQDAGQLWPVTPDSLLAFSISPNTNQSQSLDLSIELITSDGVKVRLPLSQFAAIHPPLVTQLKKLDLLDSVAKAGKSEIVLQSYQITLRAFMASNPDFQPATLRQIRFVFDRVPQGEIYLDNIGLEVGANPVISSEDQKAKLNP
ncbi:MAG TPA: hypothetical protein VH186_33505 [Chloroflexia bacterium]|nr:hypothetical protein [Chloroflexia bacterium]